MRGNRSAESSCDALNGALDQIEGAQASIARLLEAEAYDDALEQSEAMMRLAASLPAYSISSSTPEHVSRLEALMAAHTHVTTRLREIMAGLQSAKRQRHKAITAYTRL